MKIQITKINANGGGYLVVDDVNKKLPHDRARLVQAACDLRGLIGAEGLAWVTDIRPQGISVDCYSPDSTLQATSVNGAIVAALHHYRLFVEPTIEVTQRGRSCVVKVRPTESEFLFCEVLDLEISEMRDAGADTSALLKRVLPEAINSRSFEAGRKQLIVESAIVSDRSVYDLGRLVNAHLEGRDEGVAVSIMRRIGDDSAFMRTFVPGGADLVNSCSGSVAAAGFALARYMRADGSRREPFKVYGIGGAAQVRVAQNLGAEGPASVDILSRGAVVFDAEIDWDGENFEGQMDGSVFMEAMSSLADLEEAELNSIDFERFYRSDFRG